MNALQLVRPRQFEIVQVPEPCLDPGASDQLLIRTKWLSLCGSDIPFFTGGKRTRIYPLQPGSPVHECVGQVVESNSTSFHPGDFVIAIPDGNRGLAEYFIAQASRAALLPPSTAALDTCCLIQPLSTVINAVDRLGDIGECSVAVVGLGSIGQFFVWALKKQGVGSITGIDPNQQRCRAAEALGASRTISARSIEVLQSGWQDSSTWQPPDICVEAVGHQPDTLNDCIHLVRSRGTVVAFGVPDHLVYPLEFETFFRKNLRLLASVTPVWSEYLAKAADLFTKYQCELEPLVTHRFPIYRASEAYQLYSQGGDGIVKAVLDASSWGGNDNSHES